MCYALLLLYTMSCKSCACWLVINLRDDSLFFASIQFSHWTKRCITLQEDKKQSDVIYERITVHTYGLVQSFTKTKSNKGWVYVRNHITYFCDRLKELDFLYSSLLQKLLLQLIGTPFEIPLGICLLLWVIHGCITQADLFGKNRFMHFLKVS